VNEMRVLQAMRAEVPEPSDVECRAGEARLMASVQEEVTSARARVTSGRGRVAVGRRVRRPARRVAWGLALAATMAAVVVAGGLARPGDDTARPGADALRPVSAAGVLDLAARAALAEPELDPRPDQFIVYKYAKWGVVPFDAVQVVDLPLSTDELKFVPIGSDEPVKLEGPYVRGGNITVWQSVDATRKGASRLEVQQPKPVPGTPLPAIARAEAGVTEQSPYPACRPEKINIWMGFVNLSKLPTDPDAMLALMLTRSDNGQPVEKRAMTHATDIMRSGYMPQAQRAAIFKALAGLPKLKLVKDTQDAAGRRGVAVSYEDDSSGLDNQLIFDATTYRYLGERTVVRDPTRLGERLVVRDTTRWALPTGTVLSETALMSVSLADSAPEAHWPPGDPLEKCWPDR
jgi:hypothetical protein